MPTKNLIEELMKKSDKTYTDPEHRVWISAARVAEIWNERARNEYHKESNYTRWSPRSRGDKLEKLNTPMGELYLESQIRTVDLRPHPKKRPDVEELNRSRSKSSKSDND